MLDYSAQYDIPEIESLYLDTSTEKNNELGYPSIDLMLLVKRNLDMVCHSQKCSRHSSYHRKHHHHVHRGSAVHNGSLLLHFLRVELSNNIESANMVVEDVH